MTVIPIICACVSFKQVSCVKWIPETQSQVAQTGEDKMLRYGGWLSRLCVVQNIDNCLKHVYLVYKNHYGYLLTHGFVADLDEYFSVISAGLSDPKDYVH